MLPRVALDARHARAGTIWGSAVYTRELARALAARAGRDGVDVVALGHCRRMLRPHIAQR